MSWCARQYVGLLILFLAVLGRHAQAEFLEVYDYPFVDPLMATVIRTPATYQIEDLPAIVPEDNAVRLVHAIGDPTRIPSLFFYDRPGVNYGLVYQDFPAPLVVLIAGTGGGFNSATTIELARIFHKGGYHVLSIASPTFTNFMTTALPSHVPGRLDEDARAIYALVREILPAIAKRIEFTDIHLAGYSLGGIHAAYVAELDAREQAIGFERVLVMNPPVSLFGSISRLDAMLDRNLARDVQAYNALIERVFNNIALFYSRSAALDLSGDFLYAFFKFSEPSRAQLETAIGLSFRFSVANLAFVSDVMTRSGYIVPQERQLRGNASLTPYFREAMLKSFVEYFDGLYVPYFQSRIPGLTRQQAIEDASLRAIEPFLRRAEHVGLLTNADDIILGKGEIDYLDDVFGSRAAIYPTGGHCGNYLQRDVAWRIIDFFK